ncbi:MAG TPA: alpha/beta hydrolase [Polyangiales bacterium]|nr:alpha/beta hydrolase [Polyangiales bacterium]
MVAHRELMLDGMRVFYREAGPADAPVLLLPHGYPCSSYQYRNLMPALGDRFRTLAPDFPGFGYSDTPNDFRYDFDGYQHFLTRFLEQLGVEHYALYLHDYGSQIGLRLAIAAPQRVRGLIIQNGDIYEDTLGPKYAAIRKYWQSPDPEHSKPLLESVSEEGFRNEFRGELAPTMQQRIPPDLWKLHWSLTTPARRELMVGLHQGLRANLAWFPSYQRYLREHRPPTLIVWGPEDGYMPEPSARAYLRDLPDAQLHVLEGAGHWLLETHLEQALPLLRDFLSDVLLR